MAKNPGPVVRYLSTKLIEVIPEFTELEPFRDKNLNNWRSTGAYSFSSSTKNSFTLIVNSREYAAAVFADAQHLLNHASEHRAHLLDNSLPTEPSPSWTMVSLYYFSLFIIMAFSRVANNAVLYLDRDAIREFCGSVVGLPGGGAFRAISSTDPLTGVTTVEFKKASTSHFHEAAWITLNNEVSSAEKWVANLSASRNATSEEELELRALRLFSGFTFEDPLIWPSRFRNAVNYRPGFSYRSVLKHNFLKIRSKTFKSGFLSLDEVISEGEIAKNSLRGARSILDFPNEAVSLLIAQSLIVEGFTENALQNICTMRDLSCSARRLRVKYNRDYLVRDSMLKPIPL
jgi:hypothetical protein